MQLKRLTLDPHDAKRVVQRFEDDVWPHLIAEVQPDLDAWRRLLTPLTVRPPGVIPEQLCELARRYPEHRITEVELAEFEPYVLVFAELSGSEGSVTVRYRVDFIRDAWILRVAMVPSLRYHDVLFP